MKKIITKLLITSILGTTLNAYSFFENNKKYEDNVRTMQEYFDKAMTKSMEEVVKYSSELNMNYPKMDILNKPNEYIVYINLAGMKKEDINLSINEDKILKIKGENKKIKEKKENGKYIRKEIYFGSFQKEYKLPNNVDVKKIKSEYKNGILKVIIKKREIKDQYNKIIEIK